MGYLLIIVGVVFIFNGLDDLFRGKLFFSLIYLGAGTSILYLNYKNKIKSKIKNKQAEEAFLNVPIVAEAEYKHVFSNTAIALNKKQRKVILASGGSMKSYDFSQIKSWKYEMYDSGPTYGTGADGLSQAIRVTAEGMKYNNANSGLFIRVKDVEFPEWRIAFNFADTKKPAKQEMLKWMEIFDQFVNQN
jgi:Domain of unknown function (DUF4755)